MKPLLTLVDGTYIGSNTLRNERVCECVYVHIRRGGGGGGGGGEDVGGSEGGGRVVGRGRLGEGE